MKKRQNTLIQQEIIHMGYIYTLGICQYLIISYKDKIKRICKRFFRNIFSFFHQMIYIYMRLLIIVFFRLELIYEYKTMFISLAKQAQILFIFLFDKKIFSLIKITLLKDKMAIRFKNRVSVERA